jgi:hypothetical protein
MRLPAEVSLSPHHTGLLLTRARKPATAQTLIQNISDLRQGPAG